MSRLHDALFMCGKVVGCVFDIGMRILGPILVVMATGLISTVAYNFLFRIFPMVAEWYSAKWWFLFVTGIWILFNIFFNYYSCIFTAPGAPHAHSPEAGEEHAPLVDEDGDSRAGHKVKWCKKCKAPKPARAHHCHICKKCVLAMDHHCPWVATCVGHGNYRHFFLFLFYLWVGCIWAALTALSPFMGTLGGSRNRVRMRGSERSGLVFSFVLSISVGVAISIMLAWHVYLVLSAQTTIEFYQNRSRARKMRHRGKVFVNQFDLGRTRNFQTIFGKGRFWFSWMLPSWRRPEGDGQTFRTIHDTEWNTATAHVV